MRTADFISLKKEKGEYPIEKVNSSELAAEYARKFYGDDLTVYESFFLILLNTGMQTIGYNKISQGGIAGTVVDIRIIAKIAIDSLATSVILVHNHPSGRAVPSENDKDITAEVTNALNTFNIDVKDHIIITETDFYSFADEGYIYNKTLKETINANN